MAHTGASGINWSEVVMLDEVAESTESGCCCVDLVRNHTVLVSAEILGSATVGIIGRLASDECAQPVGDSISSSGLYRIPTAPRMSASADIRTGTVTVIFRFDKGI